MQSDWALVIEAKIDAWESDDQLALYDEWLAENTPGAEVLRVLLTPDARAAQTALDEWEPLSYLDLVRLFRAALPDLTSKPGYHFLRLYLAGVLRDICRWPIPMNREAVSLYQLLDYLKAGGNR
jgi:hypothetical protein